MPRCCAPLDLEQGGRTPKAPSTRFGSSCQCGSRRARRPAQLCTCRVEGQGLARFSGAESGRRLGRWRRKRSSVLFFELRAARLLGPCPSFRLCCKQLTTSSAYETGLSGAAREAAEERDGLVDRVGAIEKALGAVQKGLERLCSSSTRPSRNRARLPPLGPRRLELKSP